MPVISGCKAYNLNKHSNETFLFGSDWNDYADMSVSARYIRGRTYTNLGTNATGEPDYESKYKNRKLAYNFITVYPGDGGIDNCFGTILAKPWYYTTSYHNTYSSNSTFKIFTTKTSSTESATQNVADLSSYYASGTHKFNLNEYGARIFQFGRIFRFSGNFAYVSKAYTTADMFLLNMNLASWLGNNLNNELAAEMLAAAYDGYATAWYDSCKIEALAAINDDSIATLLLGNPASIGYCAYTTDEIHSGIVLHIHKNAGSNILTIDKATDLLTINGVHESSEARIGRLAFDFEIII